jgi:carboxymethylenebutenolidase
MPSRNESIDAGDGRQFNAHVSIPERPNGQAVIVLQEIFGVTGAVRGIADRFAEDGYLAYAPDLFWRVSPGIELSHSKEDIGKAFKILGGYSDADGVADIASTARHIRALPGFTGKVAAAGMCLGGKLAYLTATRTDVDAAVGYYGVGIEKSLATAGPVRQPLQLHFGDKDQYVSAEARRQIADALAGNPLVEIHTYPGADHGFYTRGDPRDIALARARTNDFLQRYSTAGTTHG